MAIIKGVEIQGGYFKNKERLDILYEDGTSKKDNPINEVFNHSIIYGKNGSGKSSVAQCIKNYQKESSEYSSKFYDKNGDYIDFDKNSIFVFDETFIQENILVTNDGIDAIVVLGDNIDIDSSIESKKEEIIQLEKCIDDIDFDKYSKPNSLFNIESKKADIIKIIKSQYCERDRVIKNNKNRSPYNENIYNELISKTKPGKAKSTLIKDYDEKIDILNKSRNINKVYEKLVLNFNLPKKENILYLLNKKYDKNQLSDFALQVLNILEKTNSQFVEETINLNNYGGICPLCFQQINKEHSEKINNVLNVIFDNTINEAKKILQDSKLEQIELDTLEYINILPNDIFEELNDGYNNIKNEIINFNILIDKKISTIYDSLNITDISLYERFEKFSKIIDKVNNIIDEFNDNFYNISKIKNSLNTLNYDILFYETEVILSDYKNLVDSKKKDYEVISNFNDKIRTIKEEINLLNSKKKQTKIALDEMNDQLRFIFGSSKRLKLIPGKVDGKYNVKSKENIVKESKLSVGERNIIALCYFFETIKNNCTKEDYYKKEILVVIDDPISSFDYNNELGVIDFLENMILEIYNGNKNSKVILMSHEINTCNFMFDSLKNYGRGIDNVCFKEINDGKLKNIRKEEKGIYFKLLKEVYGFAKGDNLENISLGNIIRRTLEAYIKFSYNCKLCYFFKKNIHSYLSDKEVNYFKGRTLTLLFNHESHSINALNQFAEFYDLDLFSDEDKQSVAIDTILLIYCLDKKHIMSYLSNYDSNLSYYIENWLQRII